MQHTFPSKKSLEFIIKKHLIKILTFWILPSVLRKQCNRNLRYWLNIDYKPESLLERYRYYNVQKQYQKKFAQKDIFSYRIISLGCDCMCRTIPTLWGIKPYKKQGELSYPFDLSNNPLFGILKNFRENFNNYFEKLNFDGKYWYLPQSKSSLCHEDDCGENDRDKIIERFTRRINNLKNAMTEDKPIIFINHIIPELNTLNTDENIKLYNELYDILKSFRQSRKFKLLIIDYSHLITNKGLNPEIELLSINYLPKDYIWHYPIYRYSNLGLKFEKEFIDSIEQSIDQMSKML